MFPYKYEGNLAKLNQEELYKIVAPLSTFSSLYNLFLLPILDDEFLNGEAIFSKGELIKVFLIYYLGNTFCNNYGTMLKCYTNKINVPQYRILNFVYFLII